MTEADKKILKMHPLFTLFGNFLEILADPVKYAPLIASMTEESARLEFVISKVGKAEEVDGLHEKAAADRKEAEDMLTSAKTIAGEHKHAAEEAKTTIIQKASGDAAKMRKDAEAHCDALRTKTQEFVDTANADMKSDAAELEDRKSEIKTHEIRLVAEKEKAEADRKALDAEKAAFQIRLDGFNQAFVNAQADKK